MLTILNIELSLIVMSIPPYLNFVKGNKVNHEQKNKDDLKTVEEV